MTIFWPLDQRWVTLRAAAPPASVSGWNCDEMICTAHMPKRIVAAAYASSCTHCVVRTANVPGRIVGTPAACSTG